jgi:hypothetical protein
VGGSDGGAHSPRRHPLTGTGRSAARSADGAAPRQARQWAQPAALSLTPTAGASPRTGFGVLEPAPSVTGALGAGLWVESPLVCPPGPALWLSPRAPVWPPSPVEPDVRLSERVPSAASPPFGWVAVVRRRLRAPPRRRRDGRARSLRAGSSVRVEVSVAAAPVSGPAAGGLAVSGSRPGSVPPGASVRRFAGLSSRIPVAALGARASSDSVGRATTGGSAIAVGPVSASPGCTSGVPGGALRLAAESSAPGADSMGPALPVSRSWFARTGASADSCSSRDGFTSAPMAGGRSRGGSASDPGDSLGNSGRGCAAGAAAAGPAGGSGRSGDASSRPCAGGVAWVPRVWSVSGPMLLRSMTAPRAWSCPDPWWEVVAGSVAKLARSLALIVSGRASGRISGSASGPRGAAVWAGPPAGVPRDSGLLGGSGLWARVASLVSNPGTLPSLGAG